MSSGFVPAGATEPTPEQSQREAEWSRVRNEVDKQRKPQVNQANQDGSKSLYDVLQANKAAKQEAFEESIKLKNQFRPLDDDEVDFLDSVMEADRAKEAAVRRETAEQIEAFRLQRQVAEQATSNDTDKNPDSSRSTEVWAARKRRRKDKPSDKSSLPKVRRTSSTIGDVKSAKPEPPNPEPVKDVQPSNASSNERPLTAASGLGLGLAAYSSDED